MKDLQRGNHVRASTGFYEDIDTDNSIIINFGILVMSKNKQIGQKRNTPKEIIDNILINGL